MSREINQTQNAPVLFYGSGAAIVPAVERRLIVIFLIATVGFSIAPIVNQLRGGSTKDYPLWLDTGQRELHNQTPYYFDPVHHEYPFMYPPGAAGLLALLSIGGKLPLMIFLVALNSLAWATCILAPIFLLTGTLRGQPHVLYWLPSLVCCVFIWDTYLEGQLAFCLSACLLGMLVCLQLRKHWAAGFLLALAAGFKAFPILALPYLIYRRHWKAVGCTAVFLLLFLFILPACFRGPAGAWDDLKQWKTGMMSPNTPEKIGQRAARSYTWQNGSLLAVTHRWLRHVTADHDDNVPPMWVNVADLKFETVNHIATGLSLLICLGYVAVMPRGRRRTRFTDAAEGAMLLILIIMFCPLSFNYNNSWLMCGIAVVLYFILTQPKARAIPAIIWLAIALSPLVFSVPLDHNWRHLRAMGNTLFADMALLAELGWLIGNTEPRVNANVERATSNFELRSKEGGPVP
jgi:hypothetical protein